MLACLGWSAWWYFAATAERRGVESWLAARQAAGWQASAEAIDVSGFPTDLRLRIEGLALADPATGRAWAAPVLIAESRAWSPTRITVDWPERQKIAFAGQGAEVRTAAMTSLIDLRPGPALELREGTTELAGLSIVSNAGWSASTDTATIRIAERSADLAPPNSYDIRLTADALRLPKALIDWLDPTGWLEPGIDRVTVIGHVALAEPLGLATIESGKVALRAATLREVGFDWGEMALVVSGAFTIDARGYPEGQLKVEAREWRKMLRLATGSGLIDAETAGTITKAIEFLTMLTGGGDTLSAPFNLSGGKLRIGPFPVADLPRLASPRG